MPLTLRLALRDWDYLTPLLLGEVTSPRLHLEIDRIGTLVSHVGRDPNHDAAEMSFSRYAQIKSDGDDSVVGIPNFIMRGFRHRCVITTKNSPLESLSELAGKRIGVTGWRDSGNVWTRAALRREGVGVEDARWFGGRLTKAHPITDRLDGFGRPGRIEVAPGERPMVDLLRSGELEAVLTPFMPEGFFAKDSDLRHLLRDFRTAERVYFNAVDYVPGMHLVAVKASIAAEHPWALDELSALLDETQRVWLAKRRKYADTTPWMIDEIGKLARELPDDWNRSGLVPNRAMITDFADELNAQGILADRLTVEDLFPIDVGADGTHAGRRSVATGSRSQ